MIHSQIEPVVDSQLPREQAGFRRGRSTVDQVTLLTQDLEDSFQAKAKAGVVLLDLTVAYDTVWHRLAASFSRPAMASAAGSEG